MPNGIPRWIRCYDNEGATFDRYTVAFTKKRLGGVFVYVGMSEDPFHPQGYGQHGESYTVIDTNKHGYAPAIGRKNHLGRRIRFEDLPEDCRNLVVSDYHSLWNIPRLAQ